MSSSTASSSLDCPNNGASGSTADRLLGEEGSPVPETMAECECIVGIERQLRPHRLPSVKSAVSAP